MTQISPSKTSGLRYLSPNENYWACDIEADNLLDKATRIYCACVENVLSGERLVFTTAHAFKDWLSTDYILVGHNFIGYDLPMLNRFWDAAIGVSRVVDTFVLSQLYNPVFSGGHSLGAWGERLKFPKTEYNDWSALTDEMVKYCQNDTSLTALLYRRLSVRMAGVGFSEQGVELEHQAWNIIQNKQRRNGFPFNKEKAEVLYATLRSREEGLRKEIHSCFPPELCVVGEFQRAFKKDGTPTALYSRHREQYPVVELLEGGRYRCSDYREFNIGSPKQRIQRLLAEGWTPTQWTFDKVTKEKKNPKIDEDALMEFAKSSGNKGVSAIAKWLVVNSRANMVRTWLEAYNEDTGAIHGKLFIASTLRYRHSSPNSANIPAVKAEKVDGKDKVLYGEEGGWAYECRDLFDCGDHEKYSLVGVDAKAIQIRVLLNYAFSQAALDLYLNGDPHVNNAKILGLANKPAAKKFFFTLVMGGGGARLAADQAQFGTRLTAREGDDLKAKMIATVPGFQELIDRLQTELSKTGRIKLCDGTPVLVSSPHMVIPYLLQGDESRIMKKAMVLLDREISRNGLDARKVADIHDEWQFVVANVDVERFSQLALEVFPVAGRYFNYRVPIEGDAKVGKTWSQTH